MDISLLIANLVSMNVRPTRRNAELFGARKDINVDFHESAKPLSKRAKQRARGKAKAGR